MYISGRYITVIHGVCTENLWSIYGDYMEIAYKIGRNGHFIGTSGHFLAELAGNSMIITHKI